MLSQDQLLRKFWKLRWFLCLLLFTLICIKPGLREPHRQSWTHSKQERAQARIPPAPEHRDPHLQKQDLKRQMPLHLTKWKLSLLGGFKIFLLLPDLTFIRIPWEGRGEIIAAINLLQCCSLFVLVE